MVNILPKFSLCTRLTEIGRVGVSHELSQAVCRSVSARPPLHACRPQLLIPILPLLDSIRISVTSRALPINSCCLCTTLLRGSPQLQTASNCVLNLTL
jgi:hypothetical protein